MYNSILLFFIHWGGKKIDVRIENAVILTVIICKSQNDCILFKTTTVL